MQEKCIRKGAGRIVSKNSSFKKEPILEQRNYQIDEELQDYRKSR